MRLVLYGIAENVATAIGASVTAWCTCHVSSRHLTRNVRRGFRNVVAAAGLTAKDWTPREMRHSFVSLSDEGMPIEQIARLVGHASTAVTETVYRQQIRPVIIEGAELMDRIFSGL